MSRLILTDPGNLDEDGKTLLGKIRDRCPDLNTIATSVTEFAKMISQLTGDHLDGWLTTAQASGSPNLGSFTKGLLSDYDAVRNGLTLAWNSGTVERQRQPRQNDQTPDVRPRQLHPAQQTRPPHRETAMINTKISSSPKVGQSPAEDLAEHGGTVR